MKASLKYLSFKLENLINHESVLKEHIRCFYERVTVIFASAFGPYKIKKLKQHQRSNGLTKVVSSMLLARLGKVEN